MRLTNSSTAKQEEKQGERGTPALGTAEKN